MPFPRQPKRDRKKMSGKVPSCVLCGSTQNLVNHHESYDPERIVTMCKHCHARLHGNNKDLPKRPWNFHSKLHIRKGKQVFFRIRGSLWKRFLDKVYRNHGKTSGGAIRESVEEALELWLKQK
jgi:hypothetical protein